MAGEVILKFSWWFGSLSNEINGFNYLNKLHKIENNRNLGRLTSVTLNRPRTLHTKVKSSAHTHNTESGGHECFLITVNLLLPSYWILVLSQLTIIHLLVQYYEKNV